MSFAGRLAALLAFGAMTVCAPAAAQAQQVCVDPGGIGGTGTPLAAGGLGGSGAPAAEPGVGGTGAALAGLPGGTGGTGDPARGGVGGTGAPAESGLGGTGIVGTITGFASICVNGLEVHYDDAVALSENGVAAPAGRLAVGQVVAVEAGGSARGLEARRISILHAYEGPLTSPAGAGDTLRVMGQIVRLAPGAHVDAGLRSGETVRVSGLRNAAGEVVATRIERAVGLREASAIGRLDAADRLEGVRLSGAGDAHGQEVLVRGAWRDGRLHVAIRHDDPSVPFAGRVSEAVVEGLVAAMDERELRVAGFRAQLGDGTRFAGGGRSELATDRRVRIHGTFTGPREIRASRIELVPDRILVGDERRRPGGAGAQDDASSGKESSGRSRAEGERERIEIETDAGSERIERRLSDEGQLERERIEREIVSPGGELLRRERIEVRESPDRIETRERIEIFEGGRRVERIDRVERINRSDRPDRVERVERIERVERPEKIEKPDRIERPDDH